MQKISKERIQKEVMKMLQNQYAFTAV